MTRGELLRRCAKNEEERLLLARTLDKLDLAQNRSTPAYTHFLSPAERGLVEDMLHAAGRPAHVFFGGYEGAERTVCGFAPDWMDPGDLFPGGEPVAALRICFHESAQLTHRDFLGAVLGLGITREKLGDMLVGETACDVVVLRETAAIVQSQIFEVGRYSVKCAPVALDQLEARPPEVKLVRDTVATLRLDAVAATGFSLGRGKAASLIESGRMSLNHREVTKPDRLVAEGDKIACKGLGKIVVKEASGLSRKGRVMVVLERYL